MSYISLLSEGVSFRMGGFEWWFFFNAITHLRLGQNYLLGVSFHTDRIGERRFLLYLYLIP